MVSILEIPKAPNGTPPRAETQPRTAVFSEKGPGRMAPLKAAAIGIHLKALMLIQKMQSNANRFANDRAANIGIGQNIMTVIAIVIGLALTPIVNSSVTDATNGSSTAVAAMLTLIPLVYVVLVLGIGVSVLVKQFK